MNARSAVLLAVVSLGVGMGIGLAWPRAVKEREKDSPQADSVKVASTQRRNVTVPREYAQQNAISALERVRAAIGAGGAPRLLECWAAVRELQLAECHEAARIVGALQSPERMALLEAIAQRWAELDPIDALAVAHKTRIRDFDGRLGWAAAAIMVRQDLEGALARIESLPAGRARDLTANWMVRAAAEVNPRRAAEYLSGDRSVMQNYQVVIEVAQRFGSEAPEEALAWADSLSNRQLKESSKRMIWQSWAAKDPALVAAKLTEGAKLDDNVYEAVARSWSKSDPVAAVAWVEQISNKEMQAHALRTLEIDLKELGVERARGLIEGAKSEALRNRLTEQVAGQLASEDVREALAFVNGLPEGAARERAIRPVVQEWVQQDPEAATRHLSATAEYKGHDDLLRTAIRSWGRGDPEAAAAFVEQMPPGKGHDVAAAEMVFAISEEEPKKALALLESIENETLAGGAARQLLGSFVKTDREAALAIATGLPAEAQPEAYQGLIRGWAFEEPHAAGEWINSLPTGEGRDNAIKAYVSVIDGMDAATATKWASSISEPKMRTEATMEAFQRWVNSDRQGAAAWLQQAEVAEGLRPFFEHEVKQAADREGRGFE